MQSKQAESSGPNFPEGRPRVVGTEEIRGLLSVHARQYAWKITNSYGFPEPVAKLAIGTVWFADEVEEWIRIHKA